MSITFTPAATATKSSKAAMASLTTQFSTSSGTYVDVTNMTVTISSLTAAKTYHIIAIVGGGGATTGADTVTYALLINGSIVSEVTINTFAAMHNVAFSGFASFTGATSVICKVQMKTGGVAGYFGNTGQTSTITAIALEQ